MQNSRPVAYFLLLDFGVGFGSRGNHRVPAAFRVTGGKQSQLLVLGLSLEFDNIDPFVFFDEILFLLPDPLNKGTNNS